jgi:hypothetical protein
VPEAEAEVLASGRPPRHPGLIVSTRNGSVRRARRAEADAARITVLRLPRLPIESSAIYRHAQRDAIATYSAARV